MPQISFFLFIMVCSCLKKKYVGTWIFWYNETYSGWCCCYSTSCKRWFLINIDENVIIRKKASTAPCLQIWLCQWCLSRKYCFIGQIKTVGANSLSCCLNSICNSNQRFVLCLLSFCSKNKKIIKGVFHGFKQYCMHGYLRKHNCLNMIMIFNK